MKWPKIRRKKSKNRRCKNCCKSGRPSKKKMAKRTKNFEFRIRSSFFLRSSNLWRIGATTESWSSSLEVFLFLSIGKSTNFFFQETLGQCSLKFFAMRTSSFFDDLVNQARSVIVAGFSAETEKHFRRTLFVFRRNNAAGSKKRKDQTSRKLSLDFRSTNFSINFS